MQWAVTTGAGTLNRRAVDLPQKAQFYCGCGLTRQSRLVSYPVRGMFEDRAAYENYLLAVVAESEEHAGSFRLHKFAGGGYFEVRT